MHLTCYSYYNSSSMFARTVYLRPVYVSHLKGNASSLIWQRNDLQCMVFKRKMSQKNKKKGIEDAKSEGSGPVRKYSDNSVVINIHAKPGAKQNAITDVGKEYIGVQLAAPPRDGEANTELIIFISKVLKVRKSDVQLEQGSRSRNKKLVITGISLEKITEALQAAKNE